jgi:cysteinyl-tRNA synthetase
VLLGRRARVARGVLRALLAAQRLRERGLREDVEARPCSSLSVWLRVSPHPLYRSLGNFFTIREALARYAPSALRLLLLSTHYRSAINYSTRALDEASDRMFYTYQALADADEALAGAPADDAAVAKGVAADALAAASALRALVPSALADDVNTPQARSLRPPLDRC